MQAGPDPRGHHWADRQGRQRRGGCDRRGTGIWRNVLSFIDGDELIGAHVFTAHGDTFSADPAQPIDARFQRLLQEQAGTAIVDEYRSRSARRRFWIMSHQVQLSPAASQIAALPR